MHPLSSLLADQNFVVNARFFSAVERQVHASMSAMDLSGRQSALVMRSSNEKFFARRSVSGQDCARWNMAVRWPHPGESVPAKVLKVVFENLHAIVWDVTRLFWWNDFSWQHVSFVESPANIDWWSVSIISGVTCRHTGRQALVNRRTNPVETWKEQSRLISRLERICCERGKNCCHYDKNKSSIRYTGEEFDCYVTDLNL